VQEGLVKSLGQNYFAERAGLIGDIMKQVENDKKKKTAVDMFAPGSMVRPSGDNACIGLQKAP